MIKKLKNHEKKGIKKKTNTAKKILITLTKISREIWRLWSHTGQIFKKIFSFFKMLQRSKKNEGIQS